MTKKSKKENPHVKPANKRVTFNDDIEVEEFKSHEVILSKEKNAGKSNGDVTRDISAAKERNTEENVNHEVTNKQTMEPNSDEIISDNDETNENTKECEATDAATKRPNFLTSTDNLIPLESPIEQENSLSGGTQQVIEKESGQESISEPNAAILNTNNTSTNGDAANIDMNAVATSETDQNGEEIGEQKGKLDLYDNIIRTESMEKIAALSGEEKAKIYKRKHFKKRYADIGNNLPIIREESRSRLSQMDDVSLKHDVINDVTKKPDDNTLLTREEVIDKVKKDARLSALKGQVAADKAAWSCVVRYPRRVTSLPNSRNTSPSSIDVKYHVTKPGNLLFQNEKSNTFPLNAGGKLTIYQHNFGQKYRVTNSPTTFPPLLTSPTNDVNLVTQRRSGVWVPDLSIVPRTKRHRVRTKGSRIVMYDSDK